MDIKIKSFSVDMEVKNNGVEFEIKRPNSGEHLGDLIVTKGNLIWCVGRTRRAGGKRISWDDFVAWANTQ